MTDIAPWLWILLAVAAVIAVVYFVRRKPARPYEERLEQDTVWNDPVGRDDAARAELGRTTPPTDRPLP